MISHRSQLRKRHQGDRNGRGLIHPPHHRRGLCLHPHHKCRHYHPNTLVRTLAPLAMHRSWPWSSSNVILGPITKLAGLPPSTASNDTSWLLFLFICFLRPLTTVSLTVLRHLAPAGCTRRLSDLRSLTDSSPDPWSWNIYHHIDTSPRSLPRLFIDNQLSCIFPLICNHVLPT